MRYLLLIYTDENSTEQATPDDVARISRAHSETIEDAVRRGVLVGLDKLKPTVTATTVRMDTSGALITDGPFAETKEQLAGYYMIDCADLDQAIEWAKRIPTGCQPGEGCIEIRPIQEIRKPSGLGK
ncbi:MAG TPA: YciI family protein [Bryobacteraceae bacterium]|jgi:hypothetical protein